MLEIYCQLCGYVTLFIYVILMAKVRPGCFENAGRVHFAPSQLSLQVITYGAGGPHQTLDLLPSAARCGSNHLGTLVTLSAVSVTGDQVESLAWEVYLEVLFQILLFCIFQVGRDFFHPGVEEQPWDVLDIPQNFVFQEVPVRVGRKVKGRKLLPGKSHLGVNRHLNHGYFDLSFWFWWCARKQSYERDQAVSAYRGCYVVKEE